MKIPCLDWFCDLLDMTSRIFGYSGQSDYLEAIVILALMIGFFLYALLEVLQKFSKRAIITIRDLSDNIWTYYVRFKNNKRKGEVPKNNSGKQINE